MSGIKTWIAGIGGIAAGVALILNGIAADGFSFDALKEGIGLIVGGLGLIGLGHKVEKAANGTS